jgi:hypothetical protein
LAGTWSASSSSACSQCSAGSYSVSSCEAATE